MRFARDIFKFLKNNAGNSKGEIAMRLIPDAAFGALAAAQTPGDMGDKLIAGATSAVGGSLGGIATAGLARKVGANSAVQNLADLGGSFAGDYGGMIIGDTLMRGKDALTGGQGLTPFERMSQQQQAQYAQQLEQQILAQYGLLPGTREQYAVDPTTGMGVA